MKPLDDQTLIDPSMFRPDLVVADTVYNPKRDENDSRSEKRDAKHRSAVSACCSGRGAAAFKLFTGEDMPAQEVLEKFFS